MSPRHYALLTVLAGSSAELTVNEISLRLPVGAQKNFEKPADELPKILEYLRRKGSVENSHPYYINGITRLTWLITDAGRTELGKYPAEIQDSRDVIEIAMRQLSDAVNNYWPKIRNKQEKINSLTVMAELVKPELGKQLYEIAAFLTKFDEQANDA